MSFTQIVSMKEEMEETVRFEYKPSNYPNWLKRFASATGNTVKNNSVILTEKSGRGFSKAFIIEDGFTCSVQNYQLNQPKIFIRMPADEFAVIIYLYQFEINGSIQYSLDDYSATLESGSYNTLRVVNARTLQELKLDKATNVKGVSIYLENKWIENNTSGAVADVLAHLKNVKHFKGFLQARQQKLVNEIVDMPDAHPYPQVYIKSRILRLVDKVFENFLKGGLGEIQEKTSEKDIEMLQAVEKILVENFMSPFPSVEKLSKIALMSESKLKKLFKQSYSMGLYEYFQKNRLHKAKDLILSEKHSISEVGLMLGYQNLSNFSSSFRREFNCLPSEIEKF